MEGLLVFLSMSGHSWFLCMNVLRAELNTTVHQSHSVATIKAQKELRWQVYGDLEQDHSLKEDS